MNKTGQEKAKFVKLRQETAKFVTLWQKEEKFVKDRKMKFCQNITGKSKIHQFITGRKNNVKILFGQFCLWNLKNEIQTRKMSSEGIEVSCGQFVRDFEREAKTRCNF